ncbi:uncharacterized protein LOC120356099 [Nilaparvata lugens]|uniref:uncharacterized protein LOC120356099 n=1 Tax=Nilaparvata lugens TaxID=108931 RepID=UPI00193CD571|nr:uncharacterized protein LOC120356099 [Nilaparvata lugens]
MPRLAHKHVPAVTGLNLKGSLSSSLAVRKTSTSVRNSNSSAVVNRGGRNSSSLSKNQDITTPNDTSSRKSKSGSQTSGLNRSGSPLRSSCCSGRAASPQRGTTGSSMDYGRVGQPGSSCCSGSVGKPDPCAPPPPPTYCPGRFACACCKCEPPPVPVPRCPPSKLVKMPPYSTFFDERMPVKPCVPEKDSETIGDNGSDNISYETQDINEDDKCTFPPKCCRTVYEDFVKKRNVTEPPKVKLPMIIDPCDPCAEIPREISPFEDVVNISHTCGTQTNEDQKDEKCCSNYPLRKSRIIP